jgi:hypothetical protein
VVDRHFTVNVNFVWFAENKTSEGRKFFLATAEPLAYYLGWVQATPGFAITA